MTLRIVLALSLLAIVMLMFGRTTQAQTDSSIDAQIAALRADVKANKEEIVKRAMQMTPAESESFWPVYRQYEKEMSVINDELVKLVKTYAEKFGSITDADARDLTTRELAVETKKIELKKKYFPLLSKATSSLTAAKFFQVDHRLELLFHLKLASELPALYIQAAPENPASGPAK